MKFSFFIFLFLGYYIGLFSQKIFQPDSTKKANPQLVHQFLNSRCHKVSSFKTLRTSYSFQRFPQTAAVYEPMGQYPFAIYFSPKENFESLYQIGKGVFRGFHLTVPMQYDGWYAAIIFDEQKPSMLLIDARNLRTKSVFLSNLCFTPIAMKSLFVFCLLFLSGLHQAICQA